MRFPRKLKYIIENKIPGYYFRRYPYLVEFLKKTYEFFDEEFAIEILNFTENLDTNQIAPRFLDRFYKLVANEIINLRAYSLTDRFKRLFMTMSKFLYQNKGKKLSFDIALSYLYQFYNYPEDQFIEEFDYEVKEDKNNWYSTTTEDYKKPFTFTIELEESYQKIMGDLIDNLMPVGFMSEFQFKHDLEDTLNFKDLVDSETLTTITYNEIPFTYNGDFTFNGVRTYSGHHYIEDAPEILTN